MIRMFKKFESHRDRAYNKYDTPGQINIFSSNHRKHLTSKEYMMDIDIIYTFEDKIKCIVEDKYKFINNLSSILDPDYWQRRALISLSKTTDIPILGYEKTTDEWIHIKKNNTHKYLDNMEERLKDFDIHETQNKLFLEVRFNNNIAKIIAIMYVDYLDPIIYNQLSEYYDMYKVNIIDDVIEITRDSDNVKYIISNDEDWINVYNELKLMG